MPRLDALPLQGRLPQHCVRRKALFSSRMTHKTKAPFGALAILPSHTASFAAFTGRALMTFRAGLALNSIGSLVKGLMPLRALVAGFLMTTNFAKPGTKKAPVFLSSL